MNENFEDDDLSEGGHGRGGGGHAEQLRAALPTITFDKEKFKNCGAENADKLECRICMTEFEDGDNLRLLQCMHHYHQQCIDKWFDSSSKCPLCNTDQSLQ